MKLRILGIILIVISIVIGATYSVIYYKESLQYSANAVNLEEEKVKELANEAKEEYIRENYVTNDSDTSLALDEDIVLEVETAQERIRVSDNDVVAKITIEACNIEALVYENEEENFYLHTDKDGNYSTHGEIYTNNYDDDVPIIYGHHMRDGTMFADLDCIYVGAKITLEDIGYLNDLTRTYTVESINDNIPSNEFWDFIGDVNDGLILVTCSTGNKDGRLIVIAKETPAD